jgi:hypothetical protein
MAFLFLILNSQSGWGACLTTLAPNPPFLPAEPYRSAIAEPGWSPMLMNTTLYGSDALWTMIPLNGTWNALPRTADGYRQKVFWWSEPGSGRHSKLFLTGRRLDGDAPSIAVVEVTNPYDPFGIGSAKLTMVDSPTEGCWELTGHYTGRTLRFVVRVEP